MPARSAMRRAIGLIRSVSVAAFPLPEGAGSAAVWVGSGSAARRLPPRREPRCGQIGDVLALLADECDRRAQRDRLTVAHQNLQERSVGVGLELHGRLVGLDLGEHVALFDRSRPLA